MTQADWNKALLALTIWKEAEGEPMEGKVGVGWVIRNRAMQTLPAMDWAAVMTKPYQFSSLTSPGDPRLIAWPQGNRYSWTDSMMAAEGVYTGTLVDPTGGATFYVNLGVVQPSWLKSLTFTVKLGKHSFYKEGK